MKIYLNLFFLKRKMEILDITSYIINLIKGCEAKKIFIDDSLEFENKGSTLEFKLNFNPVTDKKPFISLKLKLLPTDEESGYDIRLTINKTARAIYTKYEDKRSTECTIGFEKINFPKTRILDREIISTYSKSVKRLKIILEDLDNYTKKQSENWVLKN